MLTKDDLNEIAKLFQPLQKKVGSLEDRVGISEKRIGSLEKRMDNVEQGLKETKDDLTNSFNLLRKEMSAGEKRIRQAIRRSQNHIIDFFDKELRKTNNRVDKIEQQLKLPN